MDPQALVWMLSQSKSTSRTQAILELQPPNWVEGSTMNPSPNLQIIGVLGEIPVLP